MQGSLWHHCLRQLENEVPEQQFNTWIKPLVVQVAPDFSKVTLLVANRFKLDWIRAQYAARIGAELLLRLGMHDHARKLYEAVIACQTSGRSQATPNHCVVRPEGGNT